MHLIITHYLDREPGHVRAHLAESVPAAIDAAGQRVAAAVAPADTSIDDHHAVVHGGFDLLDGTSIDWDGIDDLTTVRFVVPWQPDDPAPTRRLLAANRFAHELSSRVRAAA